MKDECLAISGWYSAVEGLTLTGAPAAWHQLARTISGVEGPARIPLQAAELLPPGPLAAVVELSIEVRPGQVEIAWRAGVVWIAGSPACLDQLALELLWVAARLNWAGALPRRRPFERSAGQGYLSPASLPITARVQDHRAHRVPTGAHGAPSSR